MKSGPQSPIISLLTTFLLLVPRLVANDSSKYEAFLNCLEFHLDLSNQTATTNNTTSDILFSTSDPSYPSLLKAYIRNLRFNSAETPKPIFIVTPTRKTHVSASVICSQKFGFQLRTRSGGHDFEGISYSSAPSSSSTDPFVILDLFNLRAVDVNVETKTAHVMAGATLGELYYAVSEKSRVLGFPAGVCPTVGVGGHISGGGYGNMMRKHGLSIDHMIDAEIVNVNGEILNRKSMGEDLFWAIRGGGGGSFGVLLSYTVGLVPVPEIVTLFRVKRLQEENATDLVYKWQFLMQKVDDDLFIRMLLQPVNSKRRKLGKTVRVTFISLFLGSKDRLISLMDKEFPELGLREIECLEMSWGESLLNWYNYDESTKLEVLLNRSYKANYGKRKSDYVKEPIPKDGLERLWKKLSELGKPGLVFNPYGGKMSRISEIDTAFPHRAGVLYKIQYSITWHEAGVEAENMCLGLIRELHEFMTPYVSKSPRSAYLNYRDLDIGVSVKGTYEEGKVYGEKYFGRNLDRLVDVKTKVDPYNFFRNEQSVPVLASAIDKQRSSSGQEQRALSHHTDYLVNALASWIFYMLRLLC